MLPHTTDKNNEKELLKLISVRKIIKSVDKESAYANVTRRIGLHERREGRRRWLRYVAAVMLPLVVTAALWQMFLRDRNPEPLLRVSENVVLYLPNGSRIELDSGGGISIAEEYDNVVIRDSGDGGIEYSLKSKVEIDAPVSYSTLEVPKGTRYVITLEDGTRVWINASSRLRFPNYFSASERRVELVGEAYFEVTPDTDRPFIVHSGDQYLTVLGTSFNIYSYPEEEKCVTTLVNGSVGLQAAAGGEGITLRPGQQAVFLSAGTGFDITEVNTDEVTSWRYGILPLDGNTLYDVFVRLSRWYEFEFTFRDEQAASLVFRGDLKVFDSIDTIFDIIESLGQVEIKRKDDKVMISSKK